MPFSIKTSYTFNLFFIGMFFFFSINLVYGMQTDDEEDARVRKLLQNSYQLIKPLEKTSESDKEIPQKFADSNKSPREKLEEQITRKTTEHLQEITDKARDELILKRDKIIKEKKRTSNLNTEKAEEKSETQQKYPDRNFMEEMYQLSERGEKKYASILSLDGGGFRGLMEAYWLDHLEKISNRKLHKIFNLISGTSIGGILAMAATVPAEDLKTPALSTQEMIDLFEKKGNEIFPQRGRHNYLGKFYDTIREVMHCRYDEKPLESLLQSYFSSKRLNSALTHVIVTSAISDNQAQEPCLFSSLSEDTKYYMMWEVGRATSAAPTYFKSSPLVTPNSKSIKYLIDGGLWYNNPSHLAYEETLKWAEQREYPVLRDNMIMLSLGTGLMPIEFSQPQDAGWMNTARPIIESMMNISSQGVHKSMQQLLPNKNYKRINPEFKENIKLDKMGEANIDLLRKAAESKYEEIETFVKEEGLRPILEKD